MANQLAIEVTSTRSFDELCEAGRIAASQGDEAAWAIGDLACELATKYSEHTLADYAREIGKPKGSVYEYAQMSSFWVPHVRSEIEAEYPNITRSHMRKCLPLKDIDLARFAIDKCSARGWTVDQFGFILKRYRHMKGITPRHSQPAAPQRAEFAATISDGLGSLVRFNVTDADRLWDLHTAHPNATITVTVTWTAAP